MILGVQATAKELKARRAWNQKCFENPDGSHTYIIRGKRWHKKVNDQWLDDAEIQALGLVLPMTDYFGETADGEIEGISNIYATARSDSDATDTVAETARIGQLYLDPNYTCYRTFLSFDTSGIDDAADIVSAALYVKANTDVSTTDFSILIIQCEWTEALGGANQEANYDLAVNAPSELVGVFRDTASGWVSGTYYNASGLDPFISKTGDSKFALISLRDLAGTTPAGAEYVLINTSDVAGTGSDPYLSITTAERSLAVIF